MKYIKLFKDTLSVLDDLTDEQSGQLFKAIVSYSNDKEVALDGLMVAVFSQFRIQIDRAKSDYNDICERNKANGLKGGRKKATGTQSVQVEPKQSQDKDKDKDKDKEENKIYIQENLELDVLFKEYLSLRKKKRYTMSDTVVKRLLTKLKKFSDNGHNPFDVIGNAINSSWKDFYEPKTKPVSFQEQERQKTAQLGKIMSAGFDPFNQEHWDKINSIDNQGVIDAAIEH